MSAQGNDSENFQGFQGFQGDREGRPGSPSRSDFSSRLPHVFHPNRYDAYAGIVILAGSVLRYVLITLGWPASYNDEGTLGLMAMHIAYNGAHPLVYYGQDYLGSLEAYLGAGFFHLLGPSTFALRLGLLPLFALFLLCMYLLAALLYSKSLALGSLIVLALGAPDVLLRQLMAAGGTPEMFFFTSLLLLLTAWIAMTSPLPLRQVQGDTEVKQKLRLSWKRAGAYAAWGLVAGLDLWSHLLSLPFVLCAAALLLWRCRHELRLPALALLLVGLLIGVSPLIIYNVTTPVTTHELSLFTSEFGGGYREPSYPAPTGSSHTVSTIAPQPIAPQPLLQVAGALIVGIPVATNGAALCTIDQTQAWPLSSQMNSYVLACSAVHGAWSLLLLALWSISVIAALKGLRRFRSSASSTSQEQATDSSESWREANRQAARLLLLVGAGLTALAFILYPQASSVTPWTSARYLVGLLFVVPALLASLWGIGTDRRKEGGGTKGDREGPLHSSSAAPARTMTTGGEEEGEDRDGTDRIQGDRKGPLLPSSAAPARTMTTESWGGSGATSSLYGRGRWSGWAGTLAVALHPLHPIRLLRPIRLLHPIRLLRPIRPIRRLHPIAPIIRYTLLAVVLAASLLGTINIFSVQVAAARELDQQQYDLITRLTQMHATAIYMSYEDCNRLTFLSDEHIICAVLDQGLQPGLDRYFPYRAIVNSAPHPLYVFLPGSAQAIRFEQKAAAQHIPYTKSYVGGYIIYDPARRIAT